MGVCLRSGVRAKIFLRELNLESEPKSQPEPELDQEEQEIAAVIAGEMGIMKRRAAQLAREALLI